MSTYARASLGAHPPWGQSFSSAAEPKELAARTEVEFTCPDGHRMLLSFAAEAEIPDAWECRHCGKAAAAPWAPPEATPRLGAYGNPGGWAEGSGTSPMEQLRKRRTPAEGERLLAERLAEVQSARWSR